MNVVDRADDAVQPRVFGLEYDTHPAAAEFFDYSVVRDRFAEG